MLVRILRLFCYQHNKIANKAGRGSDGPFCLMTSQIAVLSRFSGTAPTFNLGLDTATAMGGRPISHPQGARIPRRAIEQGGCVDALRPCSQWPVREFDPLSISSTSCVVYLDRPQRFLRWKPTYNPNDSRLRGLRNTKFFPVTKPPERHMAKCPRMCAPTALRNGSPTGFYRRGKSACPSVSSGYDIRAEYISHRDCNAPVGVMRTEGLIR